MHQKQEERRHIAPWELVTVTDMGHIVEIQHMEKMNTSCHIQKIDKDKYVLLETGEVREFDKTENRSENANSLKKTFKKLRYLINHNFKGNPNELHVTLTYRENMKDTKRLYKDFERFLKRLRYDYKDVSTIDYINVVELQARGAWHAHLLLRFNDLDKIFIANKDLAEMWGQGFVTIKSLKDVDNIGAYLSAYLADVELTEENLIESLGKEIKFKEIDGETKKFVKGGRLHMYPTGMNLFRKSRGMEYPKRQKMTYSDIKKIVGSAEPHYFKSYKIESDDFENTLTYEQYNLKRR